MVWGLLLGHRVMMRDGFASRVFIGRVVWAHAPRGSFDCLLLLEATAEAGSKSAWATCCQKSGRTVANRRRARAWQHGRVQSAGGGVWCV